MQTFYEIVANRRVQVLSAIYASQHPKTIARKVALYSATFNSQDRLAGILPLLAEMPTEAFWRVLQSEWNACDDTWACRNELLALIRRHSAAAPIRDNRELIVYRGCSRARIRGLAWTTNRTVAARFAVGHRGIAVRNPVICRARCSTIFMRPRGRGEREVVLDPAHLKALEVFSVSSSM
jgi:hypothetical protein